MTVFGELDELFGMSDALSALHDLERLSEQELVARRSSERVEITTKVVVRPANPSQRQLWGLEACSVDISNGGCMVLASRAVLPGDLYWLQFSDEQLHIGSLLARCMRCRMVQDDTFEIGFRFLSEINLANLLSDDAAWDTSVEM